MEDKDTIIINEAFLDEVNTKLGTPTKKQLDEYKNVIENMQCAAILEDLYKYFVDKVNIFDDETKLIFEKLVESKDSSQVLQGIKDLVKCRDSNKTEEDFNE